MGSVYSATDSLSGQQVALKLLHSDSAEALQRFSREASVLAELCHPGIVSYVAHGLADNGLPFLAMEWLEGEDLAHRLARQPLSLEESLALVRQASEALALAHQQGVIHRDLKPSNLFLRNGRPQQVVVLDFGLARHVLPSSALTASQMVLGTPGYMAPEQVSSQSQITPSADIFSLGCVLYECLTGKPPFAAPHFVAALAKILFTEPEPLRSLRPEFPPALEELLQRMLTKAPERRLPEASSLLAALVELEPRLKAEPSTPAPSHAPVLQLAGAEQQLVSVLLAAPPSSAVPPAEHEDSRRSLRDALRSLLSPQGAQVEWLADGSLVATLIASYGSAMDPAALAARCALFLQERWPQAAVVLTTGRGRFDQQLPVGEAMDRAGLLLRQLPPLPPDSAAPVLLDEVTAGLLGPTFQLTRPQPGVFLLHGEQLGVDASRPLLGKPTPCVGREQELALLELAFSTCVRESIAQAILIMAPAGAGKSRLRHEFLRRLEHQEQQVLVLLGRGDPMSAGSADGLLAQALRRLCGIPGGAPLEVRQALLSQRVAQNLSPAQSQELVAFLGELCGIPFPAESSPRMRAAREDPHLMSTQVARALVAFLRSECAQHPVLLVLEDLHWGDALSVALMDEALRELAEQPFMVLALARPEVEPLLGLKMRRLQALQLRGLSRKASARLVSVVLGPQIAESLIDRLVEQAAGNALFLEELIRGVAEGRGEMTPQTVLAMLQARLGRLEPEARQILLAASFLGRSFWPGGVQTLLGEEFSAATLQHWLQRLVELEWVEPQSSSRFPAEAEYRFRHALVRDAAYALVPSSHKSTGHRLAGEWLEQVGESEPQVLAEHARLGQQPQRAIHFYLRAAEQLFERHDIPTTIRCVETALALGAHGAELLRLRALQVTTALWMGDLPKLFEKGPEVLAELKPGGLQWCWLAHGLFLGHLLSSKTEQAARFGQLLVSTRPEPEARLTYLEAITVAAFNSVWGGAHQECSALLARLFELAAEAAPEAPVERAWINSVQGCSTLFFEGQLWQACLWLEQASREGLEIGMERIVIGTQVLRAEALEAMGDRTRAESLLQETLTLARRLAQPLLNLHATLHLALFLAGSSDPAQRDKALSLTNGLEIDHLHAYAGLVYLVRAKVAAARGELSEAEHQASKACQKLATFFFYQLMAQVLLSQLLLAQGRAAEAREVAMRGVQKLEALGGTGLPAVSVYLSLAEACLADGALQEGEAALRKALQSLRRRAQELPDVAARERFLLQVPENARTLELARQRWGRE
jgi:tetratricopeptide (TPR) repeat protein